MIPTSSSSSSLIEISAALRLRPLAVPFFPEAGAAFLPFVVEGLSLADWGEVETVAEEEEDEVLVVLKPLLMFLYCWLEEGGRGC